MSDQNHERDSSDPAPAVEPSPTAGPVTPAPAGAGSGMGNMVADSLRSGPKASDVDLSGPDLGLGILTQIGLWTLGWALFSAIGSASAYGLFWDDLARSFPFIFFALNGALLLWAAFRRRRFALGMLAVYGGGLALALVFGLCLAATCGSLRNL